MGNPLKLVIVLLVSATALLAGGLLYYGLEEESPATEAAAPEVEEPKSELAGSEEGTGFLGLAAKTAKKPGAAGAGPTGPALALAELESGRAREDYLNGMFRPMAALGVDAAMAQVRQLPDAASQDMAMLALLGEWTGQSVAELVQAGNVGRFGVAGALALHLMGEGKISPEQAAVMANDFLSGGQRVGVLSRAAEKLAPSNPTAALALGEGLADWEQMRFLSRFVSGWASAAPDAAQAWVGQVEDARMRARLLQRVLAEQAKVNPAGAAQTFLQSPPEDERMRQRTAQQIAAGWAGQDTLAAMQWADNLGNEADRNAARQGIRSVAPVGIGARLSPGADGLPVLQDLVPGSPASLSGQLRSGDRLLAVSDASGSWVDARNMSLGDVVRLIQGEPNSRVSLQVQAPDGTAQRMVTLGREQIIHRPAN
jgi:hypothetical protein